LLLLLAVGIGARPVVELLPGFAGAIFQAGAEGLALMTSTVGLGAVLAGLWLAQRGPGRSLTSVALLGPIVGSLAIVAFALSPHLWVALLALLVAGSAMVASGVGTQTLLQLSVDGALRGRVLSLYGMIFRGAPAVGALAMGSLSEIFGLRWPLAGGALLAALACTLIWLRRGRLAAALEPARGEAR
jgi:MFS family permease